MIKGCVIQNTFTLLKKNILDQSKVDELAARAHWAIQFTFIAQWDIMNVKEMPYYCDLCNKQILEGDISYSPTTMKQQMPCVRI